MGILKNGLLTWLPQMTMDSLHIEAAHAVFLSAAIPLMNSTSVWMLKGIERHSKSNDMVNCGRLFACSAVGMLLVILLGSFLPVANIVFYALVSVLATGINTILISYVPYHHTESGRSSTIAGLTNSAAYLGSALSGWGLGFAAGNWGWECVNGLLLALCLLGFVVSFAASLPWRRFIDKKRFLIGKISIENLSDRKRPRQLSAGLGSGAAVCLKLLCPFFSAETNSLSGRFKGAQ